MHANHVRHTSPLATSCRLLLLLARHDEYVKRAMTGPNNVRLLTETYSVTFAPEDSSRMTLAANPSMINPYTFLKSQTDIGYVTMATADTMS